ncbi:MAG: polysaccharide deacetylase family protein [Clostridia bacterium]|nr:polysaccharide deacetylase family protein [Clostridia bacterium]
MKTAICLFLAALVALTPVVTSAAGVENWYFRFNQGAERPTVMGGSELPDKYGALYMGAEDERVIYLTFDAGYGNESLQSVLDTLKASGVTATFFILPGLIKYNLPMVEQMIADGHIVANHSYSHGNMGRINDIDAFKKELTAAEDCYREATGKELAKLFRPPEGAFSENTLRFCKELGYTPVFWSFAYADWDNGKQPNTDAALKKVLSCLHNGEIMLLHPTSATNAAILGDLIREAQSQGYRFGSLSELCSIG